MTAWHTHASDGGLEMASEKMATGKPPIPWRTVFLLSFAHMAVDATTLYVGTRLAIAAIDNGGYASALWLMAVYNCLAFAPQGLMGWFVDRLRAPVLSATVGAAMAAASFFLWPYQPMLALWIAGLGNALFHAGAGSIVLSHSYGRAAPGGVFVGPGSLGVILGTYIGYGEWPGSACIIAACLAVVVLLPLCASLPAPRPWRSDESSAAPPSSVPWPLMVLLIALLLPVIASRQFLGGSGSVSTAMMTAWISLELTAMLGKMLFGFVADRFGWFLMTVPLLFAAVPLMIFGPWLPSAGARFAVAVSAVFMVQGAMPVTLAALARILPRHSALAFGLAGSALWLGGLPTDLGWNIAPTWIFPAVQIFSAVTIAAALLLLRRARPLPVNETRDYGAVPAEGAFRT